MLRHARHLGHAERLAVAVSSRTLAELPYAAELAAEGAIVVLTREDTEGGRVAGRLTAQELTPLIIDRATFFVCGSAGFAESASGLLTDLGVPAESIRVERFGPSG